MDLNKIIEDGIQQSIKTAIPEIVEPIIRELTKDIGQPVIIKINDEPDIELGNNNHKETAFVLSALNAGLHPFLVGGAGSGKTTIAEKCSEALKLDFGAISVCGQTTQTSLLGYMNASGNYIRTKFRDIYENGGIFLLDEIDNGNPNVLAVLNSALSNDYCSFPDGMIKKHINFKLIASGNTYGTGADRQYVGRNELDSATLDRFVIIEIDYDEKLENQIVNCKPVTEFVQFIRKTIKEKNIRHIVSPRASIAIYKLAQSKINLDKIIEAVIWKGLPETSRKPILDSSKYHSLLLELSKYCEDIEGYVKEKKKRTKKESEIKELKEVPKEPDYVEEIDEIFL